MGKIKNKPLAEAQLQLGLLQEELALSSRGMAALALELEDKAVVLDKANKQLQQEIAQRKQVEERLHHLNAVLRAIRNVNQLIVKEHDRDKLLKSACENMIETRGYTATWIAVLHESRSLEAAAQAGLDDEFPILLERFKSGESVLCAREALKQSGILLKNEPVSACTECPLSKKCFGGGVLTLRMEYDGKIYGLLWASLPSAFTADDQEKSLFEEVAGDIALALNRMELENKRRQVEKELLESEKRFRIVFDSVTDGILLTDAKTRDFFMANKTMCAMLGYSEEEIKKLHINDIHPEEGLPRVIDQFEKQMKGELSLTEDLPVKRKDGTVFYADINSTLVIIDGRSYVIGVFRDITERKKTEETTRKLEAQKLVVEKMKELECAKDEFISTVTHELRTPMTPLRSIIEMLLDGSLGELTDRQEKFIRMMGRNVERLAQFTTEVLTLSRLESGRYKLVPWMLSLREVLEPVAELMEQKALGKNSSVKLDIDAGISVYADADSLSIVVTNLTNNAIVHNPEKTTVTISARQLDNGFVEVTLADNGQGIPQESLENLFDRFYQAKRQAGAGYQGTGVGLAVCKALVEAMDGEISVESHTNEGTVFRFTLPVKKGAEE